MDKIQAVISKEVFKDLKEVIKILKVIEVQYDKLEKLGFTFEIKNPSITKLFDKHIKD